MNDLYNWIKYKLIPLLKSKNEIMDHNFVAVKQQSEEITFNIDNKDGTIFILNNLENLNNLNVIEEAEKKGVIIIKH